MTKQAGLKKYSVSISGHATSITLEPEFWQLLKEFAQLDNVSLNAFITHIDANKAGNNLSSAIRVHILNRIIEKRGHNGPIL